MKLTSGDLFTAARTVYAEARGAPQMGRDAMAHVLVNRHRSGKWFTGPSLSATCQFSTVTKSGRRVYQFTCWDPKDPNYKAMMDVTFKDKVFQECIYSAIGAITGLIEDRTGGAWHYFNPDIVAEPYWAAGKQYVTIANHRYFVGID